MERAFITKANNKANETFSWKIDICRLHRARTSWNSSTRMTGKRYMELWMKSLSEKKGDEL